MRSRNGFSTPPIPEWIRTLRVDGYRNVYEYELGQRNLWGTETLFGDWRGSLLLLGKDFAPSSYVEQRIAAGEPAPYAHHPALATNRRLAALLPGDGVGVLFASACFLLRDDGEWTGPLPNVSAALRASRPVLEFTIEHMPNLRTIACLGRAAWDVVVDRRFAWREHLETRRPVEIDGVRCVALAHPGYMGTLRRGGDAIVAADWATLHGDLRRDGFAARAA